jgi:hypothetical protein
MKIAILMGRGIEGCGVTKHTIEFIKYCIEMNYEYKIFIIDDKKWPRRNMQNIFEFNHSLYSLENYNILSNEINEYDFLIIRSLPPSTNEFNHFWIILLDNINIKKVLSYHDHSILSLKRDSNLYNTIKICDLHFGYNIDNPFGKLVKQITGKNLELINKGYYFDDIDIDYENKQLNHFKFIGRTTSWKGLQDFVDFFKFCNIENKKNFIFSMEGIERSIAFVGFYNNNKEYINYNIGNVNNFWKDKNFDSNKIYIYGNFDNNEMKKRMNKCGFGFQLSKLKENYLKSFFEYTHLEIVDSKTIPIFNYAWGNNTFYNNEKLINLDCGILWYDKSTMKELLDMIEFLLVNKSIYIKILNDSYQFLKNYNNPKINFKIIIDKILGLKNE